MFIALSIFCISSSILLVITHRMVGPILRVTNILASLSKGEKFDGKISFRKKDYLKELPNIVERIAELLKNNKDGAQEDSDNKKAA